MIRRANEKIKWKPEKLCRDMRSDPEGSYECLCRVYDGEEGWYVIVNGHARAYTSDNAHALDIDRRYNDTTRPTV